MALERTTIGTAYKDVILTAGMVNGATKRRIFGVFANEEDARSERADELATATLDAKVLTQEQIEIAERNSEAL